MTVSEFISFLQTQPQHLQVACRTHSEQCLLDVADIIIVALCAPRDDGWIHNRRPDKPTQDYLFLP